MTTVSVIHHSSLILHHSSDHAFLFRALRYFRDDLPLIIASLVLIGVSTLAAVLQPFLVAILLALFMDKPSTRWVERGFFAITRLLGIQPHDRMGQIITLAVLAVALRLVQELAAMGQRLINAYIGYHGLMRVPASVSQAAGIEPGYHKSQPQGDAIYRLSYDTMGFQTILTVLVNNIIVGR